MRSFFGWLFRDLIWDNILWIGLAALVLIAIFWIASLFISDETLERWEREDREAEGGDAAASQGEGDWTDGAALMVPSLRSLGSDSDTGDAQAGIGDVLGDDDWLP